ncbi:molybdenum cofactor guanylyltransferase [Paracoccus seriniphilus]|uniref:Molybdenum cofactor guanylyltransferase n=2 Tax=Paracoccus seriniphilus TaxID=184748 RepID=A0A239PMK8_9RHOB|nr:molybdenum cofactor guanylyltransferase [Paracoccus seriniphilus]
MANINRLKFPTKYVKNVDPVNFPSPLEAGKGTGHVVSMAVFPAIILAGGRSSRMGGGDKGLLPLRGRPMIAHVIDRLTPQCAALALSANGDAQRFAEFGLPVLPDSLPDRPGPLAGILVGLDWAAAQGHAAIVSAAADTPFLPRDLVARLAAATPSGGIALATSTDGSGQIHEHPTFGMWPTALRDELRARLLRGERRVRDLARAHQARHVSWHGDGVDPFFNINTPQDLMLAQRLMAERDMS